jgi:hypothetical protein
MQRQWQFKNMILSKKRLKKPRICGRQIMRDNVEAESPEDYFRKSITAPFLYYTLNEMKTRALPMSSDLSCSDLLSPFLKARHI